MKSRYSRPLPEPPAHFSAEDRALWYDSARKARAESEAVNRSVTEIRSKSARGKSYCRKCNGPHVYKHGRP